MARRRWPLLVLVLRVAASYLLIPLLPARPAPPPVDPAFGGLRSTPRVLARALTQRRVRARRWRRAFRLLRRRQRASLRGVWLYARGARSAEQRTAVLAADALAASRSEWRTNKRDLAILCLDGGGMRGRNLVRIVEELEARAGKPASELFDLVVGTSIGGCGALFVNRFGADATAAARVALEELQLRCFAPRRFRRFFTAGHTCVDERRALVEELCGDDDALRADAGARSPRSRALTWARRLLLEGAPALGALAARDPKSAAACAVAARRGAAGEPEPYILRTYVPPSPPAFAGTSDATLSEAIVHTSAAPTFFPQSSVGAGEDAFALTDGGVAFNNPTLVALVESVSMRPGARIGCVVSVGVGAPPRRPSSPPSPERRADDAAKAVLASAYPDCVYERFDPPLAAPVDAAEAREPVLAAMEEAAAAWLNEAPQLRRLDRALAALDRPSGLEAALRTARRFSA